MGAAVGVSIPYLREITSKLTFSSAQSVRGAVRPKPNANCAGHFLSENLPSKSRKPLQILNQTRFFRKTALKVRDPLDSWAISGAFASDPRIAFVFSSIP